MTNSNIMSDILKTIRILKSQIDIIQGLQLSEEEKKLVSTALIKLNEVLLNTDSILSDLQVATNILKNQVQIIEEIDLSEEDKEILISSLNRLKDMTTKI